MKKTGSLLVMTIIFLGLFVFFSGDVSAQHEGAMNTEMPKKAPEMNPVPAQTQTPAVQAAPAAIKNQYVGADKCAACHPTEYKDFSKRKFQKSWKILKMRGEENNAQCLACHSTGHGRGGFKNENETPHLAGKQCEACHGPGGNHISNPGDAGFKNELKVSNKKNVCIECHACMTTHKSAEF